MIDESLLPVGSCVKLINNSKIIMVAGYLPYDEIKKMTYDYIGIYSPLGIRKPKKDIVLDKDYIWFKNEDIEKVIFMGYSDSKSDFYHKYLLNMKNKLGDKLENIDINLPSDELKKILEASLPNIREIKSEVLKDEK